METHSITEYDEFLNCNDPVMSSEVQCVWTDEGYRLVFAVDTNLSLLNPAEHILGLDKDQPIVTKYVITQSRSLGTIDEDGEREPPAPIYGTRLSWVDSVPKIQSAREAHGKLLSQPGLLSPDNKDEIIGKWAEVARTTEIPIRQFDESTQVLLPVTEDVKKLISSTYREISITYEWFKPLGLPSYFSEIGFSYHKTNDGIEYYFVIPKEVYDNTGMSDYWKQAEPPNEPLNYVVFKNPDTPWQPESLFIKKEENVGPVSCGDYRAPGWKKAIYSGGGQDAIQFPFLFKMTEVPSVFGNYREEKVVNVVKPLTLKEFVRNNNNRVVAKIQTLSGIDFDTFLESLNNEQGGKERLLAYYLKPTKVRQKDGVIVDGYYQLYIDTYENLEKMIQENSHVRHPEEVLGYYIGEDQVWPIDPERCSARFAFPVIIDKETGIEVIGEGEGSRWVFRARKYNPINPGSYEYVSYTGTASLKTGDNLGQLLKAYGGFGKTPKPISQYNLGK